MQEHLARAHHVANVAKDPGKTRAFYEDVIGLPLVATWTETNTFSELPDREVEYCHVFFALGDGSALAFFAFADDDVYEALAPRTSGFVHSAIAVTREVQDQMRERLEAAGSPSFSIEHGYCTSLYAKDPDGHTLEFTCEPQNAMEIATWQQETAHDTLARWLAGDRTPNNDLHHR
jgi:catechol 2,3-dioxygenase-like lactoylglutathione lyase family enzyme